MKPLHKASVPDMHTQFHETQKEFNAYLDRLSQHIEQRFADKEDFLYRNQAFLNGGVDSLKFSSAGFEHVSLGFVQKKQQDLSNSVYVYLYGTTAKEFNALAKEIKIMPGCDSVNYKDQSLKLSTNGYRAIERVMDILSPKTPPPPHLEVIHN